MPIGCTPSELRDAVAKSRDQIMQDLETHGIETRPVFYPMHIMPPYQDSNHGAFPRAELCGSRGINLPTHGRLTDHDLDRIVSALEVVIR